MNERTMVIAFLPVVTVGEEDLDVPYYLGNICKLFIPQIFIALDMAEPLRCQRQCN